MPFKSNAQRAFMYSQHPKLAKEFEDATPKGIQLPEHIKKMAYGGETSPKKETLMAMENNPTAGFAEGGEVESDNGTFKGLRDLIKKMQSKSEIAQADAVDPVVTSSTETVKGYAGGGEVDPAFMAQLNAGIPGMTTPPTPSLSATTSALNKTPDTNYDFYKDIGSDQRANLYKQLLDKQTSGGNMLAQAAGGIGDAISNSFGGQHNNFQNETQNIAAKNTENRVGAMDTQRAQRLQDMQGSQEAMMNDPNHPFAKGMQAILRSKGVNVPSGMSANILLKALGPLGELAYKEAMLGVTEHKNKADIENKQSERKQEAAKGLESRPWYQKAVEAFIPFQSDSTKTFKEELKEPPISMVPSASAPNPTSPPSHGVPDLGSTFNGGKVLKVTRVQ